MAGVSLKSGFDVDYHLGQVGVDYHLTAGGEPPGRWMGRGVQALGLTGRIGGTSAEGKANAEAMRVLYHHDVAPDGTSLTTSQRRHKYPDKGAQAAAAQERIDAQVAVLGRFATPEKIRDIEIAERAKVRSQTPFYDMVVSAEKSVSLLQVGYHAAAKRARDEGRGADAERIDGQAEQIEAAIEETASEVVAWIEQHGAYVRTGHHSATSGEWRDADGLAVGAFTQHTNRDGEPNLHVHLEILNRAQRADQADDKWRALDGTPLWADRLYIGAVATRILAQKLAALGLVLVKQEDGNGFDIGGIEQATMAAYSKRSADVDARKRELIAQYERDHGGRAPDRAALYKLRKKATVETRKAKEHPAERTAEQEAEAAQRSLAEWMRTAENESVQLLETLPEAVARFAAERGPSGMPSETERARAIRVGVAEVQRQNSTWTRGKLIWELHRALGGLPADVDPMPYLEAMADDALGGAAGPAGDGGGPDPAGAAGPVAGTEIIKVAPVPDVADVARLGLRKDGTSIYRRPGEARYVTKPHLDSEEWIVERATARRPQLVTDEQTDAALAGTDLDYQQREVVKRMLTSRVMAECLVAPAGTGKTHVMAAFAKAWAQITGGRVIGITLGENAARVMADEGMTETYNVARFLGKIKDSDKTRGHVPVYANDVLVLDEASQFATADVLRIWQILADSGARAKPVGDTEQLGPVEAGGIFRLLARKHGNWKITEVRRFAESWERAASLRLREGDVLALGEYNRHGRVYHGAADRMRDEAVDFWLADYGQGKESLLLAGSNEEAAALARMARERLIERGRLDGQAMVTLADGNQAGTGDLIRARLNTRIDAGGQALSNRDTIRITGWRRGGGILTAEAARQLRGGGWSAPFLVPASYLAEHAELGYAGNVFTAQGRTVDNGYLLVSEGMTRDLAYVGATRGRERNIMFIQTGPPDPSAPSRREREKAERDRLRAAHEHLQRGDEEAALKAFEVPPEPEPGGLAAPWEAVMAGVLAKDDTLGTALEQLKAAQDLPSNMGHLITISEAFWWQDVVPQIDEAVRQRISPREYERYLSDPERPALLQLIREHEIGGRPVEQSLDRITARSMEGARSIAGVLHGRLEKDQPPARGETKTFAERVPGGAASGICETYQAADIRQAEIGRQLAAEPEEWAIRAWGPPPAEPGVVLRDDWERRAGLVGAYRETAGITDPGQALGPVPSGKGVLREMFSASVRTLELPDERALMAAMGNEDLEARLVERERAVAVAPPDVSARLDSVERQRQIAVRQAERAREVADTRLAGSAESLVRVHDGQLAGLRVADAAHREWAEAHAGLETIAMAAARELRERGLAERIPVTDSEVAAAQATPRETPAMDPALWAQLRAEQTARVQADREAEAQKMARFTPVTDAELDRYGGRLDPELSPEAARELAELRQALRDEHHAERAGQAEALARLIPVTDAEVAKYGGVRPGDGPRPDPETWAAEKAAQTERRRAEREAEAARMGRLVPVTDAEVAAESATPRDYPAPDPVEVARWRQEQAEQAAQAREGERTIEPEPGAGRETPHVGPDVWAAQKAAQTERVDAARKARAEASASLTPVTDAEVERYGREPDITPERDADEANLAEVRAELERVGELVDRIPDRAAERHAEMDQAGINEPVIHEPQPEPSLEASWQPGDAQGQYEPAPEQDAEPEMEIG